MLLPTVTLVCRLVVVINFQLLSVLLNTGQAAVVVQVIWLFVTMRLLPDKSLNFIGMVLVVSSNLRHNSVAPNTQLLA